MMRWIQPLLTTLILISCTQPKASYEQEIASYQLELWNFYAEKETSPLDERERSEFKRKGGVQFFSIDSSFRVMAKLEKQDQKDTIMMPTSSGKWKSYSTFGKFKFQILGKAYALKVYKSHQLSNKEEYKDYLFLPFTDMTNGSETYKAGRYIDLKELNSGEEYWIDFNKAYHPYCAYTDGYSCPIPPQENHLNLPILAGVKF